MLKPISSLMKLTSRPIILGLMTVLVFTNCSKENPRELSQSQKRDLLKISQIRSQSSFSLNTGGPIDSEETLELGKVKVLPSVTPSLYAGAFDKLEILGKENSKIAVEVLPLEDNKIVFFKVIPSSKVSSLETIEEVYSFEKNGKIYVELFHFPATYKKKLIRKNDYGEETNKYDLVAAPLAEAEYVDVKFDSSKRIEKEYPLTQKRDLKKLSDFEGESFFTVTTGSKVEETNSVGVDKVKVLSENIPSAYKKVFEKLEIYGKANSKVSVEVLFLDDNKIGFFKVVSKEERSTLGKVEEVHSFEKEGKIYVELFHLPVSYKKRVISKNGKGEKSNKYELISVSKAEAEYVEIKLDSNKRVERKYTLKLENAIKVKDFKGKEFFFHNSLAESPNLVEFTFQGVAGPLEIVKFVFGDKKLHLIKADKILEKDGAGELDKASIMSFPVTYYRERPRNSEGKHITSAEVLEKPTDDAIAMVNWEGLSKTPNIYSPLSYYGSGQCFGGESRKEVSDFTRTEEGITFSLTREMFANPSGNCLNISGNREIQTSFTFKETISIKEKTQKDDKPLFDLPLTAQKLLGFGIFTGEKETPDPYGVSGVKGTKKALPAIFDIQKDPKTGKFKSITYVLAGIPALNEGETPEKVKSNNILRESIVYATMEVIRDLNIGFKKALKGTALERNEDVINLQVEEIDQALLKKVQERFSIQYGEEFNLINAPKKLLGDLSRNYIYYVRKGTSVPIIGLGANQPNPRSGKVEKASVFIYGGNMMQSVRGLRKLADYKKKFVGNYSLIKDTKRFEVKESSETPANPELTTGETDSENTEEEAVVVSGGEEGDLDSSERAPSRRDRLSFDPMENLEFRALLKPSQRTLDPDKFLGLKAQSEEAKKFLIKLNKIKEEKALSNPLMLEAILDGKVSANGEVIPDKRKMFWAKTKEKMTQNNYCLYEYGQRHSEAALLGLKKDQTDVEILMSMFKPTLAHEIGHNLGLRHNFQGSYDKRHWFFNKEDKEKSLADKGALSRDYSSVMDYSTTDHLTYDGLGPYDIHALRAAYGKTIDIPLYEKSGDEFPNKKLSLSLDFLKKYFADFYQKKSWYEITGDEVWGSPVGAYLNFACSANGTAYLDHPEKKAVCDQIKGVNPVSLQGATTSSIQFCTDDDVWLDPTCNRFDKGTTADEIVRNSIKDFKVKYERRNFKGDRLDFKRQSLGGYVAYLFGQFSELTSWVNEALFYDFYSRYYPQYKSIRDSRVRAASLGYWFLQEVVRSPDASRLNTYNTDSRFLQISKDIEGAKARESKFAFLNFGKEDIEPGKLNFIFEKKWRRDLTVPGELFKLKIRGVNYDKIVALTVLTGDASGQGKFMFDEGLALNYMAYEKEILKVDNPEKSPILTLINEVLRDDVRPLATVDVREKDENGKELNFFTAQYLPSSFAVSTSPFMRLLASQAALFGLENRNYADSSGNYPLKFTVYSNSNAPEDALSLKAYSGGPKVLWTPEGSSFGKSMILKIKQLQEMEAFETKAFEVLVGNEKERLTAPTLIEQWLELFLKEEKTEEQLTQEVNLQKALVSLLGNLPVEHFPSSFVDDEGNPQYPELLAEIGGMIKSLKAAGASFEAEIEKAKKEYRTRNPIFLKMNELTNQLTSFIKLEPLYHVFFKAIPNKEVTKAPAFNKANSFGNLIPNKEILYNKTYGYYSHLFNSVYGLADFYQMLNPGSNF